MHSSQTPGTLDDTPLVMVHSLDQLQDMMSTISSASEIAVDLEVCVCVCGQYVISHVFLSSIIPTDHFKDFYV